MSASIRRCGPSARPGFRRCIGPGSKAASRCWTRTLSPTLADAVTRETGKLECHVLPHRYVHLFPLVGTA